MKAGRLLVRAILIVVILSTGFFSCSPSTIKPSKTLTGKGVYIWQLWNLPVISESDTPIKLSWDNENGEPEEHDVMSFDTLMGLLVESDINWIAVKLGDSNSFWLREGALISKWLGIQGMTFDDFLDELRSAQIKVLGWSFVYGSSKWKSGESEVWCAEKIIESGVDGFIVNAEIHLELIPNPVLYTHAYFKKITEKYPDTFLAYTTFAEVIKHLRFPYSTFALYCDVFMPQNYWVDRNPTCDDFISPNLEMVRFQKRLNLLEKTGIRFTKSGVRENQISYEHILPIGSVESELCKIGEKNRGKHIEPDEITRFQKSSRNYFPSGFSLWSADWMSEDDWKILSKINTQ